jgi:hypothetical protein
MCPSLPSTSGVVLGWAVLCDLRALAREEVDGMWHGTRNAWGFRARCDGCWVVRRDRRGFGLWVWAVGLGCGFGLWVVVGAQMKPGIVLSDH